MMQMPTLTAPRKTTARAALWLLIGAGVLIVIAANCHLVYVALSSQPACVAHLRQGEGDGRRGLFSTAESACTPDTEGPQRLLEQRLLGRNRS